MAEVDRRSTQGSRERPTAFMRRALELAERGRRTVSPNPMVGCVIVDDGRVVGEGWHERPGGPHAEVMALAAAGERARGATAYVTLEPCTHTGRTGPCAPALVDAGIARVDIALADPNPIAAGGAAVLRAGGIDVEIGDGAGEARAQNRVFLHVLRCGRPFVILKIATSLDGRIAAADGTSQWLTGQAARDRVHVLRAEVDAVVAGSGTVLADDPALTARIAGETPRQPLRVVLDGRGRTPAGARVLDDAARTVVVTTEAGAAGLPSGVERIVVPAARLSDAGPGADLSYGVDLTATMHALVERDVRSVLVEGGAAVASSFVHAGLVDRFELHLAPVILGDAARPLFVGGPRTLADADRLAVDDVERCGDDVVLSLVSPGRPDRERRSN